MVNRAKDHFWRWEVSVTKIGATISSDAIKLFLTKYIMPKTSYKVRILVAFEEVTTALNNPKLYKWFIDDNKENKTLNEIMNIFDKNRDDESPRVKVRIRDEVRSKQLVKEKIKNLCAEFQGWKTQCANNSAKQNGWQNKARSKQ